MFVAIDHPELGPCVFRDDVLVADGYSSMKQAEQAAQGFNADYELV